MCVPSIMYLGAKPPSGVSSLRTEKQSPQWTEERRGSVLFEEVHPAQQGARLHVLLHKKNAKQRRDDEQDRHDTKRSTVNDKANDKGEP